MAKILDGNVIEVTSGTAPADTTGKLYNEGGVLKFGDMEIGDGIIPTITVLSGSSPVEYHLSYTSATRYYDDIGETISYNGIGLNILTPSANSCYSYSGVFMGTQSNIYQAPNCVYSGNLLVEATNTRVNVDFPELIVCNGQLSRDVIPTDATTFSMPKLKKVTSGLYCSWNTVSLPELRAAISIYTANNCHTVNLPKLERLTGATSIGFINPSYATLVSFTLGDTLKSVAGNVSMTQCALNQASVDNILVRFAALDGTNGTTAYSTPRTITITGTSEAPSATGLAAKAVLEARSVTVTVNS